ncbi:MAG: hypothetical protein HW390_2253 [Candidatus Brocadiaceae bacterium]|nr:hypothetical protein [Candidatus Brocadiaceae bacterium]
MDFSQRIRFVCLGICSLLLFSLILCLSTSSSPVIVKPYAYSLGSYKTLGSADVTVVGTMAYVADHSSGFLVIDVSTPSSPQLLGSYDAPGDARGVAVVGTTAYVADSYSRLQVIDVSTPSKPQLLCSYKMPCYGIAVVGTMAYVAGGDRGLQVIDVSTPSKPQLLGSIDTPGYAMAATVVGTKAYVVGMRLALADPFNGLQVIDVSTPSPRECRSRGHHGVRG